MCKEPPTTSKLDADEKFYYAYPQWQPTECSHLFHRFPVNNQNCKLYTKLFLN